MHLEEVKNIFSAKPAQPKPFSSFPFWSRRDRLRAYSSLTYSTYKILTKNIYLIFESKMFKHFFFLYNNEYCHTMNTSPHVSQQSMRSLALSQVLPPCLKQKRQHGYSLDTLQI